MKYIINRNLNTIYINNSCIETNKIPLSYILTYKLRSNENSFQNKSCAYWVDLNPAKLKTTLPKMIS